MLRNRSDRRVARATSILIVTAGATLAGADMLDVANNGVFGGTARSARGAKGATSGMLA